VRTAALAALLALAAAGAAAGEPLRNRLAGHPSPYVALHAADPVAWQPWGRAAIERARAEGKLLFVTLGYFSCHWCHVMQRESFRDPEVAAFLNAHFVPVVVDRELEPALDAALIAFVERTAGYSGWPLNVFLTPEGWPLAGTVYLPRERFLALLRRVQAAWQEDAAELARIAREGGEALRPPPLGPAPPLPRPQAARALGAAFARAALAQADELLGGFGQEARFPSAPQLEALLALAGLAPEPARVRAFLALTLDHMARLGLHDLLEGGFFRYTTDPDWRTPHFEKMLPDQALLARLYLRAARALDERRHAAVARETLDFMLRRMAAPEGGFIASLSAVDAEGVEGGHYLFDADTLAAALDPDQRRAAAEAWGLTGPAPFEAGHLPLALRAPEAAAARLGWPPERVRAALAGARARLLAVRARRTLPADRKVLAGWNGLALAALAEAADLDPRYVEAGRRLRRLLAEALWDGEALARMRLPDGRAAGTASLEDYAYAALGLAAWGRRTGDGAALALARTLLERARARFRGVRGWRLEAEPLIPYVPETPAMPDGALPSPTAAWAEAALLAARGADDPLRAQAHEALARAVPFAREDPFWFASAVRLLAAPP